MANTFSSPPVLSDTTLGFVPGEPIYADEINNLLDTLNYAIAEQGTDFVICQTFEDGIGYSNETVIPTDGGGVEIPMCKWMIPMLSEQHLVLDIYVRGYWEVLGLGGTVTFKSIGEDASQSIALPMEGLAAANDFSLTTTLDIGEDIGGYDTIEMYLTVTNALGNAVITQVCAEIRALTSPLDAVDHSGAYPFGTDTLAAADYPLPASRGHQIVDTINTLRDRPKAMLSASAIGTDYNAEFPSLDVFQDNFQAWSNFRGLALYQFKSVTVATDSAQSVSVSGEVYSTIGPDFTSTRAHEAYSYRFNYFEDVASNPFSIAYWGQR